MDNDTATKFVQALSCLIDAKISDAESRNDPNDMGSWAGLDSFQHEQEMIGLLTKESNDDGK